MSECEYGCYDGWVYIEDCWDANLPPEVFGEDEDTREAPYWDPCWCVLQKKEAANG